MSAPSWLSQYESERAENRDQARRRRVQGIMSAMSAHQDAPQVEDMTPEQRRRIEGEAGSRRQAVNLLFGRPEGVVDQGEFTGTEAARRAMEGLASTTRGGSTFGVFEGPQGQQRLTIHGPGARESGIQESEIQMPSWWQRAIGQDVGSIRAVGTPETAEERERQIGQQGMLAQVEEQRRKSLGLPPGAEGHPEVKAIQSRFEKPGRAQAREEIKRQVFEATGDVEQAERAARQWELSAQGAPQTSGDIARQMGMGAAQVAEQEAIARRTPMLDLEKKQADVARKQQQVAGETPEQRLAREREQRMGRQGQQANEARQRGLDLREQAIGNAANDAEARRNIQETYRKEMVGIQKRREDRMARSDRGFADTLERASLLERISAALASGDPNELALVATLPLPPDLEQFDFSDPNAVAGEAEATRLRLEALKEAYHQTHPPDPVDMEEATTAFYLISGRWPDEDPQQFDTWFASTYWR